MSICNETYCNVHYITIVCVSVYDAKDPVHWFYNVLEANPV